MTQTFLVEETKELIYDSDKIEEWKAKCEELGLTGQLSLMTDGKSPIPFECMNEAVKRVYETLCPMKEKYKTYHKTAIPLEVLSLIALAEKESYFDEIEIWFDDKTPDPLAVGTVKDGTWNKKYYPIARWGDVLRPFDELKTKAIAVYKNTQRLQLSGNIAEMQNRLANLEINVERYFDVQIESYSVGF